ncbi:MAG: light-harvesting protein [Pseudomonadota bacterium]
MNNSKIWLVVKPTVGVPLFLSAVAIGSFAVHVAVLSNTSWVSDFLSGRELGEGAETAMFTPYEAPDPSKVVYAVPAGDAVVDGREITVVLPDGRTATAIFEPKDLVYASVKRE